MNCNIKRTWIHNLKVYSNRNKSSQARFSGNETSEDFPLSRLVLDGPLTSS